MKRLYKKMLFCLAIICATNLNAQNLMQNPGFESGVIAPWVQGNESNGVIVEDAFEGDFGAKGHLEYYISGLEDGTTYTWTTQAKCLGECNDKNMWIGIRDLAADTLIGNFNFTAHTDYSEAMMVFTAGAGEHRFFQWGLNAGEYVTDNHVLLKEGTTSTNEFEIEANKILILSTSEGVLLSIDPSIQRADVYIHDLSGRTIYNGIVGGGMTVIPAGNFTTTGIFPVSVRTDKTLKTEKVLIRK